jgi:hypothetical protein
VPNAPSDVVSARVAADIPAVAPALDAARPVASLQAEIGGPPGPEPTRFGDWEKNGRCVDF